MRIAATAAVLTLVTACRGATMPAADASPNQTTTQSAQNAAPTRRHPGADPGHAGDGTPLAPAAGHELAAFAAGCFWGVEDNFRQVPGVISTAVGYSGGHTKSPSYENVCTHTTGHAETVLVEFDPAQVSYETLVTVFFKNHDPTTKNRQGPDIGDQYRSAIFTFSDTQAAIAQRAKEREAGELHKTVTTEIEPMDRFWKAEAYHQQYDEKTGTHSCPLPRGIKHG
jgi:peptide-methionine (S)-S-oxide reductase